MDVVLLNFWGVALYEKRQRCTGGARPAGRKERDLFFSTVACRVAICAL